MIENYKLLLFAILNSDGDPKNGNEKMQTIIYDIFNNDMPVAVFNSTKNCSKFLNIKRNTLDSMLSVNKSIVHRRFRVERVR